MRRLRIFAAALLAAAIPGAHLVDLGFTAFGAEVLILSLTFSALAAVVAFGLSNSPRAFGVFLALLVVWFADVYWITSKVTFITVAIIIVIQLWPRRFETNVLAMIAAFSAFWMLTTAITTAPKLVLTPPFELTYVDDANTQKLPPIIHIILDEQMSPAAISAKIAPGHPAAEILQDYTNLGFDVYSNAQSVSHNTYASISNLLSLSARTDNFKKNDGIYSYSLHHNHAAQALVHREYKIQIVQSDFLKVCEPNASVMCHDYTRADNFNSFDRFQLSMIDRLNITIMSLDQSYRTKSDVHGFKLYRTAIRSFQKLGYEPWPQFGYFTRPAAVLGILDQIERPLARISHGYAYFIHLLSPHSPYILDQHCKLNSPNQWTKPTREIETPANNAIRLAYWDQSVCMHRRMMALLQKVLATETGQKAIIFIHGDHGSRINGRSPADDPDDWLQTFLAVKLPNSSGKIITEKVSLQGTFASIFVKAIDR